MADSVQLAPRLERAESNKLLGFKLPSPAAIAAAAVVCTFILRLPLALVPRELSPDESQMLSQGMKFLLDPVPWRAVDGTTSGPFNSYLISALLLPGFRAGFVMAHLLADVLACLQVFLAHRTLLRIGSEKTAAVGAALMALAYGFSGDWNYVHYSSELVPTLLLMFGFYNFIVWRSALSTPRRSGGVLFVCGLALGLAPWCKLQATPVSVAMGLVVCAAVFFPAQPFCSLRSRVAQALAFCAGALLPALIVFAVLEKYRVIADFWKSYIIAGLAYAGPITIRPLLARLLHALAFAPLHDFVLITVFALCVLGWHSKLNEISTFCREHKWAVSGMLIYLAASAFAVARPDRVSPHYYMFLIPPMIYLTAVIVSRDGVVLRQDGPVSLWRRAKFLFCVLLLNVVFLAALAYIAGYAITILGTWKWVRSGPDANEEISQVVRDIQKQHPVRSLAIWGYTPGVYVLTGIPPATRDSVGHFVISDGPLRPYFRHRFVGDLQASEPDLFIDAVASGTVLLDWSEEKDGYESDPELKDFIQENYLSVAEKSLVSGKKPVRFFLRRQLRESH